jgi:glycosyltransferase involved in cell wall biosynthesis
MKEKYMYVKKMRAIFNVFNWYSARKALSVIIPVYNAEEYLEDCLLSVLNQVDSRIEVIAIDDASEDSSYEILLNSRKGNPRLKVFRNKKNLGPGPTRNLGLRKATGDYITFIDSDDIVSNTYLYDMLSSAGENNSDIVFSNIEPESIAFDKFYEKYSPVSTNLEDLPAECGMTGIIGKLFSNEFLKKNNIQFLNEKVIIGEDIPFTWISYFCAQTISFAPHAVYSYRMHEAGSDSVNDERILGIFKALNYVQSVYKKLDPFGDREYLIAYLKVSHISYNYAKLIKANNIDRMLINRYKSAAKSVLNYPVDLVFENKYIYQYYKDLYLELIE